MDFDALHNGTNDLRTIPQLDAIYRGAQPLNFLHPDLDDKARSRLTSLVINWPRLVLGAIEERLDVEGFRLASEKADDDIWRIWQANDLDEWSQQCHLDALLYGRSFVMVWPDPEDPSTPRITVESAAQMAVQYDPTTRRIVKAAKQWKEGDEKFLTVYSPTRIERFWSDSGAASQAEWRLRSEPIENLFGQVPVVPFVNRPRLIRPLGESELTDIIPMSDAINKLATDLMVAAEYHAMPRRWAVGVDLGAEDGTAERSRELIRKRWSDAAADRVWTSDSPTTQFGQFTEATLANFIQAIGMFAANIAAVSGLPPHYLAVANKGDNPASADAIRASEASLIQTVKRKQRVFGGSWERVMRLAMLVRDGGVADPAALSMETIWRDPETPTVAQKADAAVKLLTAGAISVEQAQEDLGYSPVQIERMQAQRVVADAAALKLAAATPAPMPPAAPMPMDDTAA